MGNRITPGHLFARAHFDLNQSFLRLARVQNQISTGRRLNVFSDAPADASRALDLRSTLERRIVAREAVTSARFAADSQAATLQEVSTLVVQARAKAQQAASGALSEGDRDALAAELGVLLEQVVALANQHLEGRFVFAGSRIDTLPFQVDRTAGSITSVAYAGDAIARQVQLAPGQLHEVDLTGADIFLPANRKPTLVAGPSGLLPVKGAHDTMTGSANVQLAHVATAFGDGLLGGGDSVSGLAPSGAADGILGAHSLAVTQDGSGGGTLSLDGGPTVTFTGGETDLAVAGPDGAVVHVDVSAIVPGFSGTVQLNASGTIQVGSAPPEPLVFAADVALKDGAGRVVHLDTREVRATGKNLVEFPGTATLFDVLVQLRDDVAGNSGFGGSEDLVERIQTRLASLDAAHDTVLNGLTELGARSAGFDRIAESFSLFELTIEEKRADLEDTDLLSASIELAEAESAYQSALAAAARLSRPTLLNYL